MKRGYTALVDSVGVRTGIDEICDHLTLLTRIPVTRTRASICSVVQRFGSPSVTGANRGASCDEPLGKSSVMGGGGDVQRGVTRVDVMPDRSEEVGLWFLATRSNPKHAGGQVRTFTEHSRDPDPISGGDPSEERKQRTLVGVPIRLRHGYRLPDLEGGRSGSGFMYRATKHEIRPPRAGATVPLGGGSKGR